MFKLVRYMKKYWFSILLCVGLVFIQSQSELALPDYMSDIVTNGIQSGGFNGSISEVLSEETFDHILMFASSEEQSIIQDSYEYQDSIDDDQFPKLKQGYVLKDLSSDQESELEDALLKPMIIVSTIDSMDRDSDEFKQQFGDLPEDMSVYDVLKLSGSDIIEEMVESIEIRLPQSHWL